MQQDDEVHQHTEEELTAQLIDKDNQITDVQNMLKSCQTQINQFEEHIATIQPLLESNAGNITQQLLDQARSELIKSKIVLEDVKE